jgi:hypothetical protein
VIRVRGDDPVRTPRGRQTDFAPRQAFFWRADSSQYATYPRAVGALGFRQIRSSQLDSQIRHTAHFLKVVA